MVLKGQLLLVVYDKVLEYFMAEINMAAMHIKLSTLEQGKALYCIDCIVLSKSSTTKLLTTRD